LEKIYHIPWTQDCYEVSLTLRKCYKRWPADERYERYEMGLISRMQGERALYDDISMSSN